MGLRVRKSITLVKGVRVNLGKTGASLSFGVRGLRQTINLNGKRTTSVGIPGTGISYVKTSGGGKKRQPAFSSHNPTLVQHQQQKQIEQQGNAVQVQQYNNFVNSLKSIHIHCDDNIDWGYINSLNEPYNPTGIGQRQARAIEAYENYKPNLFESIFKSLAKRKKNMLFQKIEEAALEDKAEYDEWQKLNELSKRILSGDIDAYFEVINEMNPLDDLLEYGSDFEFGANNGTAMEVEFRVKSEEIVPNYSLSLTQTGRLSNKDLTKTAYFDLVQDYVCSCSLRIACDMFALLPLNKVIVHAVDNILNGVTGCYENITILSVVFERDIINRLNIQNIDPSDAMSNFQHNMKFQKTAGFKSVDRITTY
ncbi:MAG: DUF4236 domain-containing protein [Leptospirales bacterium]|nr:DUF4236 domain-containing protein [Leptospirales bacterium]